MNSPTSIYTITAHAKQGVFKARAFGYFFTQSQAYEAIARNAGDMNEGYYTDLVLEEVSPGIHPKAIDIAWFYWDEGSWHATHRPQWAEGIVNHSIG